ncbi:hypothetical protein GIB67_036484 [Kingdonia uniflora]|uniref:GDSL esterase/lipase n=1 Tax=Kingdonia uniflora TaxID=39325 RepID=A0A7J7P7U9_9MAGN|nr:hypothetical protein GIB67_036484 [Kingdonia uniflora]
MSAVSLLSSCLLLLLVCVKSRKPLAPALYVFGDSLVDAGNNNYLKSSRGKVNYKPYGTNFEGGQPTGRYTDGKTGSDYIADFLGLPLVPPILGMSKAERKKTITGVNYASGGCGIFPETGKILGCMNFDKQLDLFERTVKEDLRYQFKTPEELSQHLSMSIFLITVGSNDYINHFFVSAFERKHITPQAFSLVLIDELRKRLEVN